MKSLVRYLRAQVPMATGIDLRPGPVTARTVALWMPLGPNVNDKGTAFAGSLASLCTVAGWAAVCLECREAGIAVDVAATEGRIRYARPVTAREVYAECRRPDAVDRDRFLSLLLETARARLTLTVHVEADGLVAVRYQGTYESRRTDRSES